MSLLSGSILSTFFLILGKLYALTFKILLIFSQSKIAVLLGERKGLQTTHSDLIRRIKMLEYALRQERIKFHRLKFGCDPPTVDLTQSPDESGLGPNEIATGN